MERKSDSQQPTSETPSSETSISESARHTSAADPEITAVNAAFAIGLIERHDLVGPDHRLYDLAHAAAADAPTVDFDRFRDLFRSLSRDPDASEFRQELVDATREYAGGSGPAAD